MLYVISGRVLPYTLHVRARAAVQRRQPHLSLPKVMCPVPRVARSGNPEASKGHSHVPAPVPVHPSRYTCSYAYTT
jgi:hypothetical protein